MFVSPSSRTRLNGIDLGIDVVFLSCTRRENDQEQSLPQEPRHQLRFSADEFPGEIVHRVRVFEDLDDFSIDT